MQNKPLRFYHLPGYHPITSLRKASLLGIGLFVLILAWPTTFVAAQTTAPTPMPTIPAEALVVIAGGHGATLYQSDGSEVAQVPAGTRLVATKRTTDGAWLYVTTATQMAGWAAEAQLIAFYRQALPTEERTIIPIVPTTAPIVEPTPLADAVAATAQPTTAAPAATVATADNMASTGARIVTDGARLNVRSGPGLDFSIIGKVLPDQAVTILAQNSDGAWTQIALPPATTALGWVASPFIAGAATAAAGSAEPIDRTAVAAPSASTAPTAVGTGGLTGKLVFQDRQGGMIYLYVLDSGALTTLTSGFDPALSPDGSRVVFTRGGGENGIYLINSDGSDEHKIFGERELLRSPKWSPDGQWIVFTRGDEFNKCYIDKETGRCFPFTPFDTTELETGKDHIRKLARIDPNGNNYRDLAVVEDAMAPDWNGAGIVYQSGAGLQITQDTPADTNRKLYFDIKRQYHQDPDWQPTGDRIVFQQRQGSHYQIFAINQDGGGLVGLTRPATALVDQLPSNVAPAWSPDGSQIVFLSNRTATNEAGPWHLWVMNSDGSNQRQLPVNVAMHYDYVTEQMVDWGR